ncbi:Charged multivesicular body protein 3 [Hondaea fermentalgiana]|uniref:Charged multivesicular body protein 3 n=1 Tax=Hondaea fermentalgiana TaxID=2315210 RepID=A0A2R5GMG8_9STRA|nr:Charged multivesicular body protein 3 [Hondaea fermentalgiana]|eukprot:GBG32092.1 Charged multivesicular body protein 3 [Hondaea fermentalgiana]
MSSEKSRTTAFLERVGLKQPDPRELVKEWTRNLRREQRMLDRQLRQIEREELKMQRDIKMLAKKGEMAAIRPLAHSLVQSKKAKNRINVTKAHMNSVNLQLRHQAAQMRMAQVMQSSTKVMAAMNSLVKMPEVAKNMQEMAMEMERAGLIEEIMDDAMESTFDDEGMDGEADAAVDQIIAELTTGLLDKAPAAPTTAPKTDLAAQGKQLYLQGLGASSDDLNISSLEDIPVAPTAPVSAPVPKGDDAVSELDRRLAALQAG